jgi:hypothetical protein
VCPSFPINTAPDTWYTIKCPDNTIGNGIKIFKDDGTELADNGIEVVGKLAKTT